MSSDHFAWRSTGSNERPISLTPRLSNSGFSLASAPSSVVQTGVKSFGCENNSAQLLPIQLWKWILPSVVSASKSGATAPICRAMVLPHIFEVAYEFVVPSLQGRSNPSERQPKKETSSPASSEHLAFSFDRRLCGKKTTAAANVVAALILPFMGRNTPGPVLMPQNPNRRRRDKWATI